MIKLFNFIRQQLFSQDIYSINGKSIILIIVLMASSYGVSQNRIPPPPCYANGNSGLGGAVGEGHFLFIGENDNPLDFHMSTGSNEINGILVLYIDTGAPGRNEIGATVDDSTDAHSIAISNSNVYGNGSVISFPTGFEASYAVAIDVNFGGLYAIPNTGPVGLGELNFITSVNSTLTSSSQGFYVFDFTYDDIGLTVTDEFRFVGLYVSDTAYSSDEGYGPGITIGTQGSDDIAFTGYITLPGCEGTLSDSDQVFNSITAFYFNNQLYIKGIKTLATIRVYDILGREIYSDHHQIEESVPIALVLNKNELQFIVIEITNKKKVLKVIPN
ncbi:hypothetical protein A9Q87_04155 [Flavobacteriales bacterium 34_180_T64]|nr:hypothetical protein A9Q87_04155 [Flavobacteriales bacterium 34_180_T64]